MELTGTIDIHNVALLQVAPCPGAVLSLKTPTAPLPSPLLPAILQDGHFSCARYTFEECMQNWPFISGMVLFQGLLYTCSKSSALRRMCPSCAPVHTKSGGLNVQKMGFLSKRWAKLCIRTDWPVRMCSVQLIRKLLQGRTQAPYL